MPRADQKPLTSAEIALSLVDRDLRLQATQMIELSAASPPIGNALLSALRAPRAPAQPWLPKVPVFTTNVPNSVGHPEVVIYVINANEGRSRPVILDFHGGGFIFGSAKDSVPILQQQAKDLDCTIITVEYRLAPETNWAGSREDNYAALKWVYANAASLGGDPDRIIVSGSSAGGGHAAVLAITARDRGEIPIHFLELASPMLDDRTGSSRDVAEHMGAISWSGALNRFAWEAYLGQPPGGSDIPTSAIASRALCLKGLPATFIHVGSLDLFAVEAMEFAQRLMRAGVGTELYVAPGVFHGGGTPTAEISTHLATLRKSAFRRAFASTEILNT